MKEIIKNILVGLSYIKGFIPMFIFFVGYVVFAILGYYKSGIISLVLAFLSIILYCLYETGKDIRGRRNG